MLHKQLVWSQLLLVLLPSTRHVQLQSHTLVLHKQRVWSRLLPALLPSASYVELRSTLQCYTSSESGHACSLPSSHPPGMFSYTSKLQCCTSCRSAHGFFLLYFLLPGQFYSYTSVLHKQRVWSPLLPALLPSATRQLPAFLPAAKYVQFHYYT